MELNLGFEVVLGWFWAGFGLVLGWFCAGKLPNLTYYRDLRICNNFAYTLKDGRTDIDIYYNTLVLDIVSFLSRISSACQLSLIHI